MTLKMKTVVLASCVLLTLKIGHVLAEEAAVSVAKDAEPLGVLRV